MSSHMEQLKFLSMAVRKFKVNGQRLEFYHEGALIGLLEEICFESTLSKI